MKKKTRGICMRRGGGLKSAFANRGDSSGSGESGKSTIVKQMKIIHQNGYTVDELAMYRLTIYKNLVDCAKALVMALQKFEIEPMVAINRVCNFARERHVGGSNNIHARQYSYYFLVMQ